MDKQFELEAADAEATLEAQGMGQQGVEEWLPLLHALDGISLALGGLALTWYVDVQPYDDTGKWRAWSTMNGTEITLEWPNY